MEQRWIKCHAMVGVTTNVITSVEVTESTANDSPQLPGLVIATPQRFDVREVSADKGYVGNRNLEAIEAVGAVPYIPFKSNNRGEGPAASAVSDLTAKELDDIPGRRFASCTPRSRPIGRRSRRRCADRAVASAHA